MRPARYGGAALIGLSLCLTGCDGSKNRGVVGIVVSNPEADQSTIRHGFHIIPNDILVEGAKVYLAFDSQGREPIPGCEATSDAKGRYKIDTKNIPPPRNPSGDYYLVVRKEGYEFYVRPIAIGVLSDYQQNTLNLLALPKKGHLPKPDQESRK
jgi:hypothetical protein